MNRSAQINRTEGLPVSREGLPRTDRIRPAMLVYMLAYVLELVFYAVNNHYLYVETGLFGLSGNTLSYVFHVLGSVTAVLLWSARFRPLVWVCSFVFAAGFIPVVFLPEGTLRLIFSIIGMAGLGGVVTACRCGYAFAANDTERLTGMSLMIVLVALVHRLSWSGVENRFTDRVLPLAVMALLLFCLLRFREEDLHAREEPVSADKKGLYWSFVFFTAYFAVDGFIYALANTSRETKADFMFLGLVLAGILLFVLIGVLKQAVRHVWSLFFVLFLAGAGIVAARSFGTVPRLQNFVLGLSVIGWPLCIYTLACALNRFASYRLLKQCTVIFALLSPLTSMFNDLVEDLLPGGLPVITLAWSLLFIALYVLTLASHTRYLFLPLAGKDPDAQVRPRPDALPEGETPAGPLPSLDDYPLTPRQKEVAGLLLSARSYRQIAAELHLSESTVKMHVTELYKRLGIGSRAELFRLFGPR